MSYQFIILLKRLRLNFISNGLKMLGVCGACFLIEACYGTPQADYANSPLKDVDVSGTIKSRDGSLAAGIPVLLTNGRYGDTLRTFTNEKGVYTFYDVRYSRQPYHVVVKNSLGNCETIDFKMNKDALIKDKGHFDVVLKSK
jgi:hypothetical protein